MHGGQQSTVTPPHPPHTHTSAGIPTCTRTKGHHAAEAADVGVELLNALDQLVARINVHTRVLVAQPATAGRRRRGPQLPPPGLLPLLLHAAGCLWAHPAAAAAGPRLQGARSLHRSCLVQKRTHGGVPYMLVCSGPCGMLGGATGWAVARQEGRGWGDGLRGSAGCGANNSDASMAMRRCAWGVQSARNSTGPALQPAQLGQLDRGWQRSIQAH